MRPITSTQHDRHPVFELHGVSGAHFRPSRSWFPVAVVAIGAARAAALLRRRAPLKVDY